MTEVEATTTNGHVKIDEEERHEAHQMKMETGQQKGEKQLQKEEEKEEQNVKTNQEMEIEQQQEKTEKNVEEQNTDEVQKQEVDAMILKQIEYYFGDYNLPRDKFLQLEIKKDDGWVTLDTMLKFKRLASLSSDKATIVAALRNASTFIEVHEEEEKIRRSASRPLPIFDDNLKEETMKRTVYCKGFAKDGSVTLDHLLEFFQQYGPYDTVLMRYFFDRDSKRQGFKGSVLVVFGNREKAEEFFNITEVKYNGTQLLRKWHEDYIEEKRKEIEERKARKEAKRKKDEETAIQNEEEEEELPRGTFLHFSGVSEGSEMTREDVKEALGETQEACAWVDYSRGMKNGYLRFKEPGSNKTVLEKLNGTLKVKEMEITLRLVEGEEEEEQLTKMKAARSKARANSAGRKRKVGRGGGGSFHKRRRT